MSEVERPPKIYDVVQLSEMERGALCPLHTGDPPSRCNNTVEYVFVYEASLNPGDDRRRNCRCCAECKPSTIERDDR